MPTSTLLVIVIYRGHGYNTTVMCRTLFTLQTPLYGTSFLGTEFLGLLFKVHARNMGVSCYWAWFGLALIPFRSPALSLVS